MRYHPGAEEAYQAFAREVPHADLTIKELDSKIQRLENHLSRYRALHNTGTAFLLLGLFSLLLAIPVFSGRLLGPSWPSVLVVGLFSGFLSYTISVYTKFEGASHELLWLGNKKINRALSVLCRLFFVDPDSKANCQWSKKRALIWGAAAHFILIVWSAQFIDWLPAIFAFVVVAPWLAMLLDRMSISSDHLLIREAEPRQLRVGFWGLLVCDGAWGKACHLSHHLASHLPWYQQLRLHRVLFHALSGKKQKLFVNHRHGSPHRPLRTSHLADIR